ncbi:hypothetical protein OQJ18_06115 [Fluoribacter dumoffii]|uniref:Uncharacterized protein n=1 Tax=Fluoribacter dumoffii TaxID=463 RepID=A0A377G8N8_9GAMM|nr:hypothetical protein [Fluoribacter dumoffii]KTC89986.1 hypothetical protein Ldum_1054 [Fluoribacter dumoffii NY 23]MCW8385283.1 hypothetical protein [Fluoribacter dumoffii]MCW8418337.1 hypothetical protein [Fluoribacter dumoffii]MCW8453821.1 hypothetical protein [Fluoribacter dumoffii]MCW8462108.1 hypothetical protein [Fluoribacter dumoffii]
MFVNQLQKAITYLRETQEIALFLTMADVRLATAFRASPLFYITLPFIGFLLTINALINGYQLAQANNRNFDRWVLFITSVMCAVLASISLYGGALSAFFNFNFAAGPWFFFSSLIVALSHQLVMSGLNLLRAFESPKDSVQRMHYLQAAFNNLFGVTFLLSALGAVTFVLLFPVIPAVGAAFSITAVLFTACDILWRITPNELKQLIKGWLHLRKPNVHQDAIANQKEFHRPQDSKEIEPNHHRMFTCYDYSALIRTMDLEQATAFLSGAIQEKLKRLEHHDSKNKVIKDKIDLLTATLKVITHAESVSKKELLKKYPLAFQSFWAEKGDVEHLFNAVLILQGKHYFNNATSISPTI